MTRHKGKHVRWEFYPDLLLPGETRVMVDDLVFELRMRESFIQIQNRATAETLSERSEDIAREHLDRLLVLTKPPAST